MEVDDEKPWTEKYRPTAEEHFAGDIAAELVQLAKGITKFNAPNLLFYGPPGSGKSSAKEFWIKLLNIKPQNVRKSNAAQERGIQDIRNMTRFRSTNKEPMLQVFEEGDQMTDDAFQCMRRRIEESNGYITYMIICNNREKIPEAIRSRFTEIQFHALPLPSSCAVLKTIAQKENVRITSKALKLVVRCSLGDMRRATNLLYACNLVKKKTKRDGKIQCKDVRVAAGLPQLEELLQCTNLKQVHERGAQWLKKSIDVGLMIRTMHDYIFEDRKETEEQQRSPDASLFPEFLVSLAKWELDYKKGKDSCYLVHVIIVAFWKLYQ